VKSLEELKLTASDFKAFNKGRFLDYYDIGRVLGEGKRNDNFTYYRCLWLSL